MHMDSFRESFNSLVSVIYEIWKNSYFGKIHIFGKKLSKIAFLAKNHYANYHQTQQMWYHLVDNLIFFHMIPHTWVKKLPFKSYLQKYQIQVTYGGHFEKMAAIFFQQHIFKVVHLEVVRDGLLNTLIPNNLLQQPMSGFLQKWGFAPWVTCIL